MHLYLPRNLSLPRFDDFPLMLCPTSLRVQNVIAISLTKLNPSISQKTLSHQLEVRLSSEKFWSSVQEQ